MLKNYIKIALRNIWRHKGYSFINIAGLAVGMACCILILLWVQNELSYDRFHKNANELYRVVSKSVHDDSKYVVSPAPFAAELKEEYPEIINSIRFRFRWRLLKYKKISFYEEIAFTDPSFFEMFSYPFIKGNSKTALSDPLSIVLTEDMSQKYFGNEEPIGKTILFENHRPLKVTGVLQNLPHNSHIQADFFIPFAYLKEDGEPIDYWGEDAYNIYVLLQKNTSIQELNRKIYDSVKKHRSPEFSLRHYLQPVTRIHLFSSDIIDNVSINGNIKYVYIFSLLALFILIIGCINFMNLATARSSTRAKEVGMRKVVGAKRTDIIKQFLGETILLAFIALILAIALVELFLPAFNNLLEKKLSLSFTGDIPIIPGLICIALLTGILSGSYPALFLSSFKPTKILTGSVNEGRKSISLRKILVVIQFSIAIVVIITTFIIYKQLEYVRNRKLGFDKENLIYLYMGRDIRYNYKTIKNELLQNPNIVSVSASRHLPIRIGSQTSLNDWEGKRTDERGIHIHTLYADYDFLKTYKMEMSQGRFFSRKYSTDGQEAVIVNETLVKAANMKSPIGKRIQYNTADCCNIIGVIKDFHNRSLHTEIDPTIMRLPKNAERLSYLTVRIKSDASDISGLIKFLKNIWDKYSPNYPFEYTFLNDRLNEFYFEEERTGKILSYFAFLAIFISCLGLFGLASFSTEQRTKEIGIRKVLGATVPNIIFLLTKDFTKWVLIGNIIAWPVAYYVMHRWLQNFAYRTNIGISTFIISAALALMIALATVSYQSIKAALANPIEALRYE